jgi:MFS family permease
VSLLHLWTRGASSRVGRYTQRPHLVSALLEGAVMGTFLLNEYVAKKTLDAGDAVITALVMAPTASLLFSAWWSSFLLGREKRSTFLLFGILGRLSLLLVAFLAGAGGFTAVIAAATFLFGAVIPASNALLQRNYSVAERGRVVGMVAAGQALVVIGVSLALGRLYDLRPGAFRAVYPLAAACGFVACLSLARIRFRARPGEPRERPLFRPGFARELLRSLRAPFAGAFGILRHDRGFRRYEAAFMAYGLAWMMLQPVIPVFLVERLHVAYSQVSHARGLIYFSVIACLSPLFGRLLDRTDPLRISRFGFLVLALFPVALAFARGVPMVYAAFFVFGVGMAAVNLGWTMGPIHFARDRDSAGYMGAHVALVGLRSLVGGPLGIWFYRAAGSPAATFAVMAGLFLLASWIMGQASRLRDAPPRGPLGTIP